MELYQVPFAQKLKSTKTCILKIMCILFMSECVFELCEVTLNPKNNDLRIREQQSNGKENTKKNKNSHNWEWSFLTKLS